MAAHHGWVLLVSVLYCTGPYLLIAGRCMHCTWRLTLPPPRLHSGSLALCCQGEARARRLHRCSFFASSLSFILRVKINRHR
ncbi:hypothetical protein HOY80DRAFT_942683 [Tuber brumale]|nr:hypothetical protein HOY80DRAFT_942683 [Tuber brumale]